MLAVYLLATLQDVSIALSNHPTFITYLHVTYLIIIMQEDMATVIANLYRTYIFDKPLQGIIAPYDRRMSEIMNYVAERGIKRLVVSFHCL